MRTLNVSRSSGLLQRMLKSSSSVIGRGLSGLWQLMIRKRQPKQLSSLYTRCSQTPLDVFIDVLVNKNLSRLIRSGKANPKQLADAWEQLFNDYAEISGSPEYQRLVNLSREIGGLQSKILSIQLCIQVLGYRYSSKCIATLKRFGYNYRFNIQDPEGYLRDLKSVATKSKTVELALDQALLQYNKLMNQSSGKELTEEYFQKILVELSKFMGFRVNAREITVGEYVAMIKRREKEIELLSNQIPNKKAHGYNN